MESVRVLCPQCGKKYKVPEDQLHRRIECKECGGKFRLGDGRGEQPSGQSAPKGETKWFVVLQGKQQGPMPREQVVSLLEGGEIGGDALVWHDGMSNWQPIESLPDFAPWMRAESGHAAGAMGDMGVERGPLVSPGHFSHAFQGAFVFNENRIPKRLIEYVAPNERVLMAFSLSGVSCIISLVKVCWFPALVTLIGLFAALVGPVEMVAVAFGWFIITLVLALMVYLHWLNMGYILTDKRLLGRRGVFRVRWVFLNRNLVNAVEIKTGILDKLFGMENVTVSALNGYIVARGLSSDVSRKLVALMAGEAEMEPEEKEEEPEE